MGKAFLEYSTAEAKAHEWEPTKWVHGMMNVPACLT